MTDFYTDKNDIKILFPKEKWTYILEKSGHNDTNAFNTNEVASIFRFSISEFESGGLSIDDLSEISSKLSLALKTNSGEDFTKLKETLNSAAELSFYVRMEDPTIFSSILKSVRAWAKS